MTRRLRVPWPDPRPFHDGRETFRLLAVSDEPDPALAEPSNRQALGHVDLVLGCGDLEPDQLQFVADAFVAPLLYVRGNHDRGLGWRAGRQRLPDPLPDGRYTDEGGIPVIGLSWPGVERSLGARDESAAWFQVARTGIASLLRVAERAVIVISHAPPEGFGDVGGDAYHRGFAAYRWLMERLRPPLWLHGHTPVAAAPDWRCESGRTTLVNVTGAVLVELVPASGDHETTAGR